VTPWLAVGGETFWLGQQRKSGTGFAARLHDDKSVATAQVASTGVVSLTYVHRVSEKVRPARACSRRQPWCLSMLRGLLASDLSGGRSAFVAPEVKVKKCTQPLAGLRMHVAARQWDFSNVTHVHAP